MAVSPLTTTSVSSDVTSVIVYEILCYLNYLYVIFNCKQSKGCQFMKRKEIMQHDTNKQSKQK